MSRRALLGGLIVLGLIAAAVGASLALSVGGGDVPEPSTSDSSGAADTIDGFDPKKAITVLSPDSIPSIDDPKFVPVDQADFLALREPVISLEFQGEARAYPLQIMTWHEIVNDVVAGQPIAITYCPLCNTALAYPRVHEGTVLEFGTSGKLYNSALMMYDRQTESLWLHFEAVAVQGPLAGARLEFIPVQTLSFAQFRDEHPDGLVLTRDTGFDREYGTNPYDFYDTNEVPFLFPGEVDPRLGTMERIVGVALEDEAVAYPYLLLSNGGKAKAAAIHDSVGNDDIVVFWMAGVASALDTPAIARGRDVGSSGVFVPEADGQRLTFEVRGAQIVDTQTGSVWSLSGKAVSGELEGTQLLPVIHLDTFWFAWQAHKPRTEVWGLSPRA